jgi:hypothetical protein
MWKALSIGQNEVLEILLQLFTGVTTNTWSESTMFSYGDGGATKKVLLKYLLADVGRS